MHKYMYTWYDSSANECKGSVSMTVLSQQEINRSIEVLMNNLTKNASVEQFTNVIQQNIDTKRLSATSETDFFDRLMLNIAYFVENKKYWTETLQSLINSDLLPSVTSVEVKSLEKQMVIREAIASQMEDYINIFHNQYSALQVKSEDVIYDYAYASVEHSLRFDFLSYLLKQSNAKSLLAGDANEVVRIIDGYVSYYTDQFVNQMELK